MKSITDIVEDVGRCNPRYRSAGRQSNQPRVVGRVGEPRGTQSSGRVKRLPTAKFFYQRPESDAAQPEIRKPRNRAMHDGGTRANCAIEVAQTELLLQILVVLLNAATHFRDIHQALQRRCDQP